MLSAGAVAFPHESHPLGFFEKLLNPAFLIFPSFLQTPTSIHREKLVKEIFLSTRVAHFLSRRAPRIRINIKRSQYPGVKS